MDITKITNGIQKAIYKGSFICSDGNFESFFVDPTDFVINWELLNSVSELFSIILKSLKAKKIFVEKYGGLHLATLISQKSKLPLIVVRKPLERSLTWTLKGEIENKEEVIGIDEITITGNKILEVVPVLRKNGLIVNKTVTFIDLGRGARDNLDKIGVKLISLFEVKEKGGEIKISKSPELIKLLGGEHGN